MLRFLRSRLSSTDSSSQPLSEETKDYLTNFNKNLELIESLPEEPDRLSIFSQLINCFEESFREVNKEHAFHTSIRNMIDKYVVACSQLGQHLFKNTTMYTKMINSLLRISDLIDKIPNAIEYFSYFSELIQYLKSDSTILNISKPLLIKLFQDIDFFAEFENMEGFALVFTSFFISCDKAEPLEIFLDILFDEIPKSFYKSQISRTTIDIVIHALRDECHEKCAEFIVNYLAVYSYTNPDIYQIFDESGGFVSLINYLVLNNSEQSNYDIFYLLLKQETYDEYVVKAIYELYSRETTTSVTRGTIIQLIINIVQMNNVHQTKIFGVVSLEEWIYPIPKLTSDSLNKIANFIISLAEEQNMTLEFLVPHIINLLKLPNHPDFPVEKYLEILHVVMLQNQNSTFLLVDNKFFDNFIFNTTEDNFFNFFQQYPTFQRILFLMFTSPDAEEYRLSIAQTIVDVAMHHDNGFPVFHSFLAELLNQTFSIGLMNLLMSKISCKPLCTLMIQEVKKRPEAYHYFIDLNGFNILNELLKTSPKDVIQLVAALVNFGPQSKIDEWILTLPLDSPFFEGNDELLSQAAYCFSEDKSLLYIPSLLPYCKEFNKYSPLNLYNAGRYGVPSYIKRGVPASEIKNIDLISNRFAGPGLTQHLLKSPKTLFKSIDMNHPHFPLFEFIPNHGPAFMQIQKVYTKISFWFYFPSEIKKQTTIFKCNNAIIQAFQQSLVLQTMYGQESLVCECKKWNHIIINLFVERNSVTKVNMLLNLTPTRIIKSSSDAIPQLAYFGDEVQSLKHAIYISRAICFNEQDDKKLYKLGPRMQFNLTNIQLNNSVYKVHYCGFASYFDSWLKRESLFQLLETAESIEDFKSIYLSLLSLQKIQKIDLTVFWDRIMFALKRRPELINDDIVLYLGQIPKMFYKAKKQTRLIEAILKNAEFYFIFSEEAVLSYINFIKSEFSDTETHIDIKYLEEQGNISDSLLKIMRTGTSTEITNALASLIYVILDINPTRANIIHFLIVVITSGDWSLQLPMSINEFPFSSLINISVPESKLQSRLLSVWSTLAQNYEEELFSNHQLLADSMLFDDERSFYLIDTLISYSYRNPKYLQNSYILSYVFSRLALQKEGWTRMFALLCATNSVNRFPDKPEIKRENAVPSLLNMLCSLTQACAKAEIYGKENPHRELLVTVLDILLDIPDQQKGIFYDSPSRTLFSLFTNMGMIPRSVSLGLLDERAENNWNTFQPIQVIKNDDMKKLQEYNDVYKHPDIVNAAINININVDLPFELQDITWASKMPTTIYTFIILVLMNYDINSFPKNLAEVLAGNSLMYNQYSFEFMRNLTAGTLIQMTLNDNKKIPLPIVQILNCIKLGVFRDVRYIHLLTNLISLLKLRFDNEYIPFFRDIILCSFIFVQEHLYPELFKLFYSFRSIIFLPHIFKDVVFSSNWYYIISKYGMSIQQYYDLFVSYIDTNIIIKYNNELSEAKWKSYVESMSGYVINNDNRNRIAQNIINYTTIHIMEGNKAILMSRVTRAGRLYVSTNEQIDAVNMLLRNYEKRYYDFTSLSRTLQLSQSFDIKSYHLSPIALPVYSPRAVTPSPFSIISPEFGKKPPLKDYTRPYKPSTSKIPQVEIFGVLKMSPEWYYFDMNDGHSAYDYSYVIPQNPSRLVDLFKKTYSFVSNITKIFSVDFYYYIHSIPSVLFFGENQMILLVLATFENGKLELIKQPEAPIAFLPFTESVALNEWHQSSMFCGHIVLVFDTSRLVTSRPHLFVHQKRAISIYTLFDPNFIVIFKTTNEYEVAHQWLKEKSQSYFLNHLSSHNFLFNYHISDAMIKWLNGEIGTFDYLVVLNYFGGRSYSDLAQYPVFPWVTSPTLDPRNLELPMGQLSEKRAIHYDQTFEESDPKYFYGCHYSLPGVVFWFMMRMPPYTFFQWDLNNGWDDSQRLFTSILDCYRSASDSNQADLKELIPQLYSVPEIFANICKLPFSSDINENVALPEWANESPQVYVNVTRKFLEKSEDIHQWIDLIFGYKQTGQEAIKAKNVFLPSSYHNYINSDTFLDEKAFEDQVINFGQCPIQIFPKEHPARSTRARINLRSFEQRITKSSIPLRNPLNLEKFKLSKKATALPKKSVSIPPKYDYFINIEDEMLSIQELESFNTVFSIALFDFASTTHISISKDALFVAVSFFTGKVMIFNLIHNKQVPTSLDSISHYTRHSSCQRSEVLSTDFLCASLFDQEIVIWNIATKLCHRSIKLSSIPFNFFFDDFDGLLTIATKNKIEQYTLNGVLTRDYDFDVEIINVSLIPYDFTFDGRIFAAGDVDGNLTLLTATATDDHLNKIGVRKVHKEKMIAMFIDEYENNIYTCDTLNHVTMLSYTIFDDDGPSVRCSLCLNEATAKCIRCGNFVCDKCLQGNVCTSCVNDFSAFNHHF